ncbi:olfactory receptor 11G2-like [Cyanocitta cristata]
MTAKVDTADPIPEQLLLLVSSKSHAGACGQHLHSPMFFFLLSLALSDLGVFIVFSYVQIFRAVLRIPSEQGRHKAFSTCLPHLAVLSLFLSTVMFSCLKPPSISSPSLDVAVGFLPWGSPVAMVTP